MESSGRILLIDDHPLFRYGLKSLIQQALPDSEILEAGTLAAARELLLDNLFETVILDVSLPDGDGISFAGEILEANPELRVFILSMHRRSGMISQARKLGCRGYFLKEGDGSYLLGALTSEDTTFLTSMNPGETGSGGEDPVDMVQLYAQLTRREKEVFSLLAQGNGYKEVAWNLGISSRTASVHRYNIFQKLRISTEIELLHLARDVGLII